MILAAVHPCHLSLATYQLLRTICHLLPTTYHLLPITFYQPPTTHYLTEAAYYLTPATCHLPPTTCHPPPTIHCSPLTRYHMPSATCRPPATISRLVPEAYHYTSFSIPHLEPYVGAYCQVWLRANFILKSIVGCIEPCRLEVCHRGLLGAYWRACSRVYVGVTYKCTSEGTWLGSIFRDVVGRRTGGVHRGVHGSRL